MLERIPPSAGLLLAFLLLTAANQYQDSTDYLLPYPAGDSARLIQGNNGRFGHEGHVAYAFDFIMPIGRTVSAARAGEVVAVEERFVDGNRTPGEENLVVIQHTDSTFTRYYHLTQDGVDVDVGATVAAGDPIGRSGNTGASAGPHLHFDVTTGCFDWGCQTVPIDFSNAGQPGLVEREIYPALPAGR